MSAGKNNRTENANPAFERVADILVVGGGVAGIAAAVQCARSGWDVVLLEKTILPGGLATLGLVNVFLPLCDGEGNQVLGGIAEEFFNAAVNLGPGVIPPNWRKKNKENSKAKRKICRFASEFSPATFALALESILDQAGVDVWYDTVATETIVENNTTRGVKAFNKSGNGILSAKIIVDATGDADVARAAGCAMVDGQSELSPWFLEASLDSARKAASLNAPELLAKMVRLGADSSSTEPNFSIPAWRGIDGKIVSESARETRRLIMQRYLNSKQPQDTSPRNFPLALPTLPQLRTTRRIKGLATMDGTKNRQDRVAFIPDWKRRGIVWEMPLGALIPERLDGILVAGRCVSAKNGDAWEAARSIPAAATTGQIAGIAASLALQNNTLSIGKIPPQSVEKLMRSPQIAKNDKKNKTPH